MGCKALFTSSYSYTTTGSLASNCSNLNFNDFFKKKYCTIFVNDMTTNTKSVSFKNEKKCTSNFHRNLPLKDGLKLD